jgi:2-iminobutanoate/2-iminopropanoate deaminase
LPFYFILKQCINNKEKFFSCKLSASLAVVFGCNSAAPAEASAPKAGAKEQPVYFNLRPQLEKSYGYSHAVKIGDDLKIPDAVSMNHSGIIVAPGNMEQQMNNCDADLQKILQYYGYTFDDVVVENVYNTNMKDFINVSGYRNSIYTKQFATGTWL